MSLADRLRRRIAEQGPIPVSEYVTAALYDEREGFYQAGGQAGRGGDFLTSVEVGPLFGAVVARAIDTWWRGFGCPQRFCVYEWGPDRARWPARLLPLNPKRSAPARSSGMRLNGQPLSGLSILNTRCWFLRRPDLSIRSGWGRVGQRTLGQFGIRPLRAPWSAVV